MADEKKPKQAQGGEGKAGKGAPKGKGDAKGKPAAAKGDAAPRSFARPKDYKPRLKAHYEKVVREALTKKFSYGNSMMIPRLERIVLNMGVGETTSDRKILDHAIGDMTKIAGQKPVATRSRKSIATFKVRQDYPIGCMVTLRGKRMYEFLDRLVTVAMPRIRDFRGVSGRAFDGRGNYSMGVKEQIIFPEIDYDKIDTLRGMNISITTSAKSDDEARALLAAFRFPFKSN